MKFKKDSCKIKSGLKTGFTLLELLIVIAIIGVLTALAVNRWMVSAERAKVVEIEKSVRSLKDYIDIDGFDSVTKVREVSPQTIVLGKILYEIADMKDVKKTYHFLGDLPDFGIVFACNGPSSNCYGTQHDGKIFNKSGGPVIFYAIGKQETCSLDEAVYHSAMVSGGSLPSLLTTNRENNSPTKVGQMTFSKAGKTYKTNYCLVPLLSNFELE